MVFTAIVPAFANEEAEVNEAVIQSFQKEFKGVEVLKWEKEDAVFKAIFLYGEKRVAAFFSENGTFLGSIRGLFFNQLPLTVSSAVNKQFSSPVIIEANEISNENGTSYKVLLESGGKKYQVKTNAEGMILSKEKLK